MIIRMAAYMKKTTGLTGLAVVKHPEYLLRTYYGKILRTLAKIPPDAAYRKYTEDLVKNKLQIVLDSKSVEEIETKINCGQVEELILQAKAELLISRKFLMWKPWEPLIEKPASNQWTWPPTSEQPNKPGV